MIPDAGHSLAVLTEEEWDRGVMLLAEGCCPHCSTVLDRVETKKGEQAGRCALSGWSYRLERNGGELAIVSTGDVSLRVVSVPQQSPVLPPEGTDGA